MMHIHHIEGLYLAWISWKSFFTSPSFDLLFQRPSKAFIAASLNLWSPNWNIEFNNKAILKKELLVTLLFLLNTGYFIHSGGSTSIRNKRILCLLHTILWQCFNGLSYYLLMRNIHQLLYTTLKLYVTHFFTPISTKQARIVRHLSHSEKDYTTKLIMLNLFLCFQGKIVTVVFWLQCQLD